jgi:hypothetical protein
MESIKEESPLQEALNNKSYFSNASLWNNRNRNFAALMLNPKTDYLFHRSRKSTMSDYRLPNSWKRAAIVPLIKTSYAVDNESVTKPTGERNKVKFSDTVTVAVVI